MAGATANTWAAEEAKLVRLLRRLQQLVSGAPRGRSPASGLPLHAAAAAAASAAPPSALLTPVASLLPQTHLAPSVSLRLWSTRTTPSRRRCWSRCGNTPSCCSAESGPNPSEQTGATGTRRLAARGRPPSMPISGGLERLRCRVHSMRLPAQHWLSLGWLAVGGGSWHRATRTAHSPVAAGRTRSTWRWSSGG